MRLNNLKYKYKFNHALIYYKKSGGYFYIKIYNKFIFLQYLINKSFLLTFISIIQFLYKLGVKIN